MNIRKYQASKSGWGFLFRHSLMNRFIDRIVYIGDGEKWDLTRYANSKSKSRWYVFLCFALFSQGEFIRNRPKPFQGHDSRQVLTLLWHNLFYLCIHIEEAEACCGFDDDFRTSGAKWPAWWSLCWLPWPVGWPPCMASNIPLLSYLSFQAHGWRCG